MGIEPKLYESTMANTILANEAKIASLRASLTTL